MCVMLGNNTERAKTQAVHLLNSSGGIYKTCDAPMSSCHGANNLKDQHFHCFDTRSVLSIKAAGPALKGNQLWLWEMMNTVWPLKLNAFSLPWITSPVFCSVEGHRVLLLSFTSTNQLRKEDAVSLTNLIFMSPLGWSLVRENKWHMFPIWAIGNQREMTGMAPGWS